MNNQFWIYIKYLAYLFLCLNYVYGSACVSTHQIINLLLYYGINWSHGQLNLIQIATYNRLTYINHIMNQGFNNTTSPYGQITSDQIYKPNDIDVAKDIRRSFIPDDGYAADVNQLRQSKSSMHARSLISTIILFGGIITILALYFNYIIDVTPGGIAGICAGFYVFYLMLALICNPLFSYLNNIEHGINFTKAYEQTRAIIGHFSFHVQCYHYETRYHTRTVRDNDGNTRTQTYTTNQKVTTHTATQTLHTRQCVDTSGFVDQVRAATQIIFIHNIVNYQFKDQYSRGRFEFEWDSFRNRHRFDVHQDYSQNFILPGLKARRCFYVGNRPTNYKCYLIIMSLIGLIWPYSMYIQSKVSRFNIQYMKVVAL